MDVSSFSINTISSLPRLGWDLYIDYLWNWTDYPNSWISRIAYTSRVLAILFILPIVILTLLDLASYGIARTLGVIDDVKASTSDKETIHNKVPLVQVLDASTPASSSPSDADTLLPSEYNSSTDTLPPPSHPHAYFMSEENSLKLSGVGVFSPAASRPPSPTITRRNLQLGGDAETDEGITFRKRLPKRTEQQ
ncbi:hypothetical protein C8J57DRAFT_1496262 [Mycena rebaudengoi]|nr:hypothetical protein C8J57DRAFT_1496262 [Mycena rebaudengoi]